MKLYTSAAVARYLDMTERNVRTLRDKGILTEYKPGLYDLQTATKQYINFLRQKNPEAEEKVGGEDPGAENRQGALCPGVGYVGLQFDRFVFGSHFRGVEGKSV